MLPNLTLRVADFRYGAINGIDVCADAGFDDAGGKSFARVAAPVYAHPHRNFAQLSFLFVFVAFPISQGYL